MGSAEGRADESRGSYKQERKAAFLRKFRDTGTIASASRAVRIDRGTVLRWRKQDPEFEQAFEEANEDVTESLEQCAIQRAKSKSDLMLIFLLKNRAPERYGDQKWRSLGEEVTRVISSRLVDVIRSTVPDHCPTCKTHLDTTRKLAEKINGVSQDFSA